MRIPWLPIIGAAVALIGTKIIGHYFGTVAALIAAGVLVLCWFGSYMFYRKQLVKLHALWANLDEKGRAEMRSRISPEMQKDLARFDAKAKNA